MSIYSDSRIPYFYIIEHISSGQLYAGSKDSKNCTPGTLMKIGGYLTSSNTILHIIDLEGINSFRVIDTITLDEMIMPFGWNSVRDYETHFLKSNQCAQSDVWINGHNNENINMPFGSPKFNQIMLLKHGDIHFNNRDKYVDTCIKEYGVTSTNKLDSQKIKSKKTSVSKFGVESHMQLPGGSPFLKAAMLDKYGVENSMQIPEVRAKAMITKRKTYLERPDVVCPHCNETSIASGISNMKRYHFDNCKLVNSTPRTIKPSNEVVCPHCNKAIKARGAGGHFDNCKYKIK